ncbi:MAG: phosphoribosylformylglycinamidine synthase [Bacteroidales bacterium]|nr:phosphoribosylformylglycinamidine synthase [Bacteroidales bacterium]
MILFFENEDSLFCVDSSVQLNRADLDKLLWLFRYPEFLRVTQVEGPFVGPRKEMITPWSTNAVEITLNMGIAGIRRIEQFYRVRTAREVFDPMLQARYQQLDQDIFSVDLQPDPVLPVTDIAQYNELEGLALSDDEINYLKEISKKIGRPLTDSEVFGFSQVNSEHCRHKIFNGTFIIDDEEMPDSLFALIKKTSKVNPNEIVSAYSDNVAFVAGPKAEQFAPEHPERAGYFSVREIDTVLSLKAETHNFPTTVEPFNGAATGSGGEIRDRMGGGKAGIPLIGTAVYMTSYPRLTHGKQWEEHHKERPWLYHSPSEILIKASNGASDFGNKFGQPLLCGSLLTFEHQEPDHAWGFDKVIMLAGGVGFARKEDSLKDVPEPGDIIVVLGGDNYRIGMGGGAVSSVATGEYENAIELNAIQRSNPEMQKRVFNALRALAESVHNPIVSLHDHGAGGHLNCLSELVEATGGTIDTDQLPVGDPTLSAREIIGNESQERMGLVIRQKGLSLLEDIAERERAPVYRVGVVTGDMKLRFTSNKEKQSPIDLELEYLFGKPPKTVLTDETVTLQFPDPDYRISRFEFYLSQVLQLESVACKDWLTNKVDRSVTGKGVVQQCAGEIQLPLNDLAVVALDYTGSGGIATAIGHAPVAALADEAAGSRLAVAEALTNLVWAPLSNGLRSVSLSANWMWPAKNPGENARLYRAVQSLSDFSCALGINVPTGKDSMSMTQKYPGGEVVYSPGTVIVSAMGAVDRIRKVVSQVMQPDKTTGLVYVDLSDGKFSLGGSSFFQTLSSVGVQTPDTAAPGLFATTFAVLQELIQDQLIISGHDVSAGGLITTLLEMCFANRQGGAAINLSTFPVDDPVRILFSEQPSVVIQVREVDRVMTRLKQKGITHYLLGQPVPEREMRILSGENRWTLDIDRYREDWYRTSYHFDRLQTLPELALERMNRFAAQPLIFRFPESFTGRSATWGTRWSGTFKKGAKAAIIREKGVNGDREMAYAMYLAGMEVKDIHMTDLISGRETLDDVHMIVFVGGFSNSDVLGSARGWAGAFRYNEKARVALENFYRRDDTLSLGVCNGCQLMMEMHLIDPAMPDHPEMKVNRSGKFESAFLTVDIPKNQSVMLGSLAESRLGIWVAHGEGRFEFPYPLDHYHVAARYSYHEYPGNPNGSPERIAALCSSDGRHLAMMPHLERAFLPWQWAHYPSDRQQDEVAPWLEAFVNARNWINDKITQR